jgi:hypothetical protein
MRKRTALGALFALIRGCKYTGGTGVEYINGESMDVEEIEELSIDLSSSDENSNIGGDVDNDGMDNGYGKWRIIADGG